MRSFEYNYFLETPISHQFLTAIRTIGEFKGRQMLYAEQSPEVLETLRRVAMVQSAESSNRIEGVTVAPGRIDALVLKKTPPMDRSEQEVAGYRAVLTSNHANHSKMRLSADLILNWHKTLYRYTKEKGGKWKTMDNSILEVRPDGKQFVRFQPVSATTTPKFMDSLIKSFNNSTAEGKVDPLLSVATFILDFECIHPFMDGNGRTTRLAAKALLAAMGLNTFNLFSFENYYNQNVGKYFEQVGILGNYYDEKDKVDFTRWLEYFTGGIIDELLRVKKELETATPTPETALKPYHQQILGHIKDHGYVTDRDYSLITKRAKATRNHDFNKLLSLGLIEKSGKGKATYYKLKTAN